MRITAYRPRANRVNPFLPIRVISTFYPDATLIGAEVRKQSSRYIRIVYVEYLSLSARSYEKFQPFCTDHTALVRAEKCSDATYCATDP